MSRFLTAAPGENGQGGKRCGEKRRQVADVSVSAIINPISAGAFEV
jgi:hypothetical protein